MGYTIVGFEQVRASDDFSFLLVFIVMFCFDRFALRRCLCCCLRGSFMTRFYLFSPAFTTNSVLIFFDNIPLRGLLYSTHFVCVRLLFWSNCISHLYFRLVWCVCLSSQNFTLHVFIYATGNYIYSPSDTRNDHEFGWYPQRQQQQELRNFFGFKFPETAYVANFVSHTNQKMKKKDGAWFVASEKRFLTVSWLDLGYLLPKLVLYFLPSIPLGIVVLTSFCMRLSVVLAWLYFVLLRVWPVCLQNFTFL